jgi:hypothetical protein
VVRSRAGSGTRSTGPGVGVTAVMDHSKETYSSGLANLATALSNLGHSAGGGDGVARVIRSRHRAPDRRPARSPDRAPRRAGTDGPARAEAVALVFVGELNLDDDTPGVFVPPLAGSVGDGGLGQVVAMGAPPTACRGFPVEDVDRQPVVREPRLRSNTCTVLPSGGRVVRGYWL